MIRFLRSWKRVITYSVAPLARMSSVPARRSSRKPNRSALAWRAELDAHRIPPGARVLVDVNDPIAFVELESAFRDTMERGGSGARLVQVFTDESEHSYLSDPEYPALLASLLAWADGGDKPTPQSVAAKCKTMEGQFGPGCRLVVDFKPAPLDARVTPRNR